MTRFDLGGLPPTEGPALYVLFLRQAKGDETQLVQGLFPAAGEGTQGMFMVPVPELRGYQSGDYCIGIFMQVSGKPWDTVTQTNQGPVTVLPDTNHPPDPNEPDLLFKKYNGKHASEFLKEVQPAAAQGITEASSGR